MVGRSPSPGNGWVAATGLSRLQAVVAILVLVGATLLAVLGLIDGPSAVTVYGVVLGYVFGFQAGSRTNGIKA